MVQPAEDRAGADRVGARLRRGPWRLQGQAPVRAVGVVGGDVLAEHGPQVVLVQDDEVVEALAAEGVLFRYIGTAPGPATSWPARWPGSEARGMGSLDTQAGPW